MEEEEEEEEDKINLKKLRV